MLRGTPVRTVLFGSLLPFDFGGPDTPIGKEDSTRKKLPPGLDRIRNIFILGSDGGLTRELKSIMSVSISGFVMGGMYSSMMNLRPDTEKFRDNNQLVRYHSHYDAGRRMQNFIFRNFLMNFLRTGGKVGLFCLVYSATTTFTTAYKAKYEVSNHMLGGGFAGCLFKLNMGLKGMFAGTMIGMFFGAISGLLSHGILYVAGMSVEDMQDRTGMWLDDRKKKIHKQEKKNALQLERLTDAERSYAQAKILQEQLDGRET